MLMGLCASSCSKANAHDGTQADSMCIVDSDSVRIADSIRVADSTYTSRCFSLAT